VSAHLTFDLGFDPERQKLPTVGWIALSDRCEADASRRQLSLQLGQLVGGGTQHHGVSAGFYFVVCALARCVRHLRREETSGQVGTDDDVMRDGVGG
jgi:hypothetical protein